MCKKWYVMLIICGLCMMLLSCGPSDEKVAEAQQKYTELVEIHNQVVEVHKSVEDNSLDEQLTGLREKIGEVESYNLSEMKDEEIDELIQTMDTLIEDYETYLTALIDIKGDEEAAVLTPILITIVNQTGFSFTELKLYEEGEAGSHENMLSGLRDFVAGETLAGLVVQRDVDYTPWILELKDSEGVTYELSLPVEEYGEEGVKLILSYDSESGEMALARS